MTLEAKYQPTNKDNKDIIYDVISTTLTYFLLVFMAIDPHLLTHFLISSQSKTAHESHDFEFHSIYHMETNRQQFATHP